MLNKFPKSTQAEPDTKLKRRQDQARDGLKAAAEYEAAAIAMRAKTAKLRALRLAKEADDAAHAAANPPEPVVKVKKSKPKKKVE